MYVYILCACLAVVCMFVSCT